MMVIKLSIVRLLLGLAVCPIQFRQQTYELWRRIIPMTVLFGSTYRVRLKKYALRRSGSDTVHEAK